MQDKNASARLCAKNAGGGGIFAGHYDLFLVVLETLCTSSLQSYVQVL